MKHKPIRQVHTVKVSKRVTKHVEPEDLERFVRNELDPKKQKRTRKHLAGCTQCAVRVSRLRLFEHVELMRF